MYEMEDCCDVLIQVLNLVTDSVCITDIDGNIIHVNQAFCNSCQYSREELIGENPRLLKSGIHGSKFYAEMWNIITSGEVWKGTIINKTKNDELYTDKIMISSIKNDDEDIIYYICTRYNIDDTHDLLEQLEQIVIKVQSDLGDGEF